TAVSECGIVTCTGEMRFDAVNGAVITLEKLTTILGRTHNFLARSGGKLNLPQITSVTSERGYNILFQAEGAHSAIQLPKLQSVTATTSCNFISGCAGYVEFDGVDGGEITLDSLTQIGGQSY